MQTDVLIVAHAQTLVLQAQLLQVSKDILQRVHLSNKNRCLSGIPLVGMPLFLYLRR
jgi:hypothetical protein